MTQIDGLLKNIVEYIHKLIVWLLSCEVENGILLTFFTYKKFFYTEIAESIDAKTAVAVLVWLVNVIDNRV